MTSAHLPATPQIKERPGGTGVPPVLHRPEACATMLGAILGPCRLRASLMFQKLPGKLFGSLQEHMSEKNGNFSFYDCNLV
jgi:hypothetical protein